MGNRAIVIFTDAANGDIGPAVYLHWNGGPESIEAFVQEMDRRQMRVDTSYETARFIQIVGEFFDGDDSYSTLSLGVYNGPKEISEKALGEGFNHGDNGVYVIDRGAKTWRRFGGSGWFEGDMPERTAESVQLEREMARKNETFIGITEFFDERAKGRKIRGG